MNSGKGSIILLMVIATATLLVAVAGTTFAYFGATMNGDTEPVIEYSNGSIYVEYDTNKRIKGKELNFNDTLTTKTFTVTGIITGSSNMNYEANLIVKNNSYKDGALVYTLTSKNTSNNGSTIASTSTPVAIPTGESTISLGRGLFAGPTTDGSSHKYTLKITYVNPDNTPNPDLEASMEAELNITQVSQK